MTATPPAAHQTAGGRQQKVRLPALALLLALPQATPIPPDEATSPRLVVVISVDQMIPEQLDRLPARIRKDRWVEAKGNGKGKGTSQPGRKPGGNAGGK